MTENCAGCKYSHLERQVAANGQVTAARKCRRFPPAVLWAMSPQGAGALKVYPGVEETEWCGEFAARGVSIESKTPKIYTKVVQLKPLD